MTGTPQEQIPVTLQELYDQLELRVADTSRLREAERVLNLPRNDRIQHLVEQVAGQLKVPWCALTIVTEDEQHFLHSSEEFVASCKRDGTQCQFVVTARGTVAINNVDKHSFWRTFVKGLTPSGKPLQAYLGVPLRVRGEIVGSLCIVDTEPREWTAPEHYVLTDASNQIGRVLAEAEAEDDPRA